MDWLDLVQDRHNLWAAVDAVKNILLPHKAGNFLKGRGRISFLRNTVLHVVS
jgi:hypothetical protein